MKGSGGGRGEAEGRGSSRRRAASSERRGGSKAVEDANAITTPFAPQPVPKDERSDARSVALVLLYVVVGVVLCGLAAPRVWWVEKEARPAWVEAWEMVSRFGVVAVVWGMTNPWLEAGARTAAQLASASDSGVFPVWNVAFAIPFLANKAGTVLQSLLVSSYPPRVVNPSINGLTLFVTVLTSLAFGLSRPSSLRVAAGLALIVAGVVLCNAAT
jgi:Putative transmembrane family 234